MLVHFPVMFCVFICSLRIWCIDSRSFISCHSAWCNFTGLLPLGIEIYIIKLILILLLDSFWQLRSCAGGEGERKKKTRNLQFRLLNSSESFKIMQNCIGVLLKGFCHIFSSLRSCVCLFCFANSFLILQWNPVNTVTNGTKKFGHINEGFFTRKCMAVFARWPKKSGSNNKVTILPRWP